ncbi:hypothetical protein JCM11251_007306 [Rhodosporidiobolus azoricus]
MASLESLTSTDLGHRDEGVLQDGGRMLRNIFLNRLFVRTTIFSLNAVAPLCTIYLILSLFTYPAPPLVVFTTHLSLSQSVDFLLRFDKPLRLFTLYCLAESLWWIIAFVGKAFLSRGVGDYNPEESAPIGSEERWRLWVGMVQSSRDPWDWLAGFFLPPGHKRAPSGANDPLLKKVKPDQVGRTNIEEFISHFMFSTPFRALKSAPRPLRTLPLAELHSMILLLEAQITLSRPDATQPFKFLRGRSPHRVFHLQAEPLGKGHHPLLFYWGIHVATQACNLALYCAGFRYYSAETRFTSLFPPFFHRPSRRSLESVLDPLEAEKMGDSRLADKVGYWYKPASQKRLEEDARPIVFCHGISGLFAVTPFVLGLSYLNGRAMFMPELPYLSMRLSPPSQMLTRLEYVSAVRRMLWAHGFGLTSLDPTSDDESFVGEVDDGEEEWRRAKCVVVSHSFGAGAAAWLLRDAPDLIAGTVFIDPMAPLLFSASTARNFFRTKCRTAGELFFRYFASERGINHFLSRHLRWSDSVVFGPESPAPLPQRVVEALVPRCARERLDPEEDCPFYAPWVTPSPEGPLPTIIFLAEKDCILPTQQMQTYLEKSGFSTTSPPPPYSEKTITDGSSPASSSPSPPLQDGDVAPPPLRIMLGLEHGAVLTRLDWCREVAKAVEAVAAAAEKWETEE